MKRYQDRVDRQHAPEQPPRFIAWSDTKRPESGLTKKTKRPPQKRQSYLPKCADTIEADVVTERKDNAPRRRRGRRMRAGFVGGSL